METKSLNMDVKSRARNGPSSLPANRRHAASKPSDYGSEGVEDHDIFQLPSSDYKIMLLLTAIGTVVRLFRIYQPSSVVFDEVQ